MMMLFVDQIVEICLIYCGTFPFDIIDDFIPQATVRAPSVMRFLRRALYIVWRGRAAKGDCYRAAANQARTEKD